MTTFITKLDEPGPGRCLAVKDCIDVAGTITTNGSPAVAFAAVPATRDAKCVARARAAGARVVGKANLHELCHGGTGINQHYGTPLNPRDARRIPGGSSSGCAVAVATGEADVAFGTDTSGSIRIPAAACGVAGLKTTFGLIPLAGVLPLAPSLDTVGPLAADVSGLVLGMSWLIPGFKMGLASEQVLRLRTDVTVRTEIDVAVDDALRAAGYSVRDTVVSGWADAAYLADRITEAEAYRSWGHLLDHPHRLGTDVRALLENASTVTDAELDHLLEEAVALRNRLTGLLEPGTVLALPTLVDEPPLLADASSAQLGELCGPASAAGLCGLTMPLPTPRLIASMQLLAPPGGESVLLATAARIEAAIVGHRSKTGGT